MANIYFRPDYESTGMRGMQFHFYCRFCNESIPITGLVGELLKYGMKDCPTQLYQAWKILRLGSLEFADRPDREHRIIKAALGEIDQGKGIDNNSIM